MSSQLAVLDHHPPAPVEAFDDRRLKLIRETFANDAPPLEFELFIAVCKRTGLSPEARQIYFICRGGKWTIQTGIDGYRLIADRTQRYVGSDDYVYDTEEKPHPNKATVTVWKLVGGQRHPFTASARWEEYVATNQYGKTTNQWATMPYLMLGKCAEALALRKAFPAELSGVYTDAEMDQAGGNVIEAEAVSVREAPAAFPTQQDLRRLHAIGRDRQLTHADLHALAFAWFGRRSVKDLMPPEMGGMVNNLDRRSAQALTDERVKTEVALAYQAIEEAKAGQAGTDPAPSDEAGGEPTPMLTWDGLWNFCQEAGVPTGRAGLEGWLGESVKELTPQQARELVELRLSERAELDAQAG